MRGSFEMYATFKGIQALKRRIRRPQRDRTGISSLQIRIRRRADSPCSPHVPHLISSYGQKPVTPTHRLLIATTHQVYQPQHSTSHVSEVARSTQRHTLFTTRQSQDEFSSPRRLPQH